MSNKVFIVGLVSSFQSNPRHAHSKEVNDILCYLSGKINYMLYYQRGDIRVYGYTDADCDADLDGRKSTSGLVFLQNESAISWTSKKQFCIVLSIME